MEMTNITVTEGGACHNVWAVPEVEQHRYFVADCCDRICHEKHLVALHYYGAVDCAGGCDKSCTATQGKKSGQCSSLTLRYDRLFGVRVFPTFFLSSGRKAGQIKYVDLDFNLIISYWK